MLKNSPPKHVANTQSKYLAVQNCETPSLNDVAPLRETLKQGKPNNKPLRITSDHNGFLYLSSKGPGARSTVTRSPSAARARMTGDHADKTAREERRAAVFFYTLASDLASDGTQTLRVRSAAARLVKYIDEVQRNSDDPSVPDTPRLRALVAELDDAREPGSSVTTEESTRSSTSARGATPPPGADQWTTVDVKAALSGGETPSAFVKGLSERMEKTLLEASKSRALTADEQDRLVAAQQYLTIIQQPRTGDALVRLDNDTSPGQVPNHVEK